MLSRCVCNNLNSPSLVNFLISKSGVFFFENVKCSSISDVLGEVTLQKTDRSRRPGAVTSLSNILSFSYKGDLNQKRKIYGYIQKKPSTDLDAG